MSGYVFEPPPRPSLAVRGSRSLFPVRRIYCVGRAGRRDQGHDSEPVFERRLTETRNRSMCSLGGR